MKTFSKIIQLIVFSIVFSISTNFVYAQDPDQYGTPFSGVPDAVDAVIYQVNMRCFSSTRDFQGVIDRLDNIKDLGVNVIYLMPVYPVGTLNAFNSPYCIKDLYSVGSEFGTLDDLRALVDGAHERNMAVILDWVQNQTSWDHPWITEHKDWYQQDGSGNILQFSNYSDVAALDFGNSEMRAEMIKAMRYWIFTANVDGFRCDGANSPPVDFWKEAITSLRSITSHKLILLAEGDRTANYTAGFDLIFGFQFYYNSVVPIYKNNSSVTLINNSNNAEYLNATANQSVARYLSNHDIYGSDGSPYTIFGGKTGTLAAFAVTAWMKSVPFIYNGMEVGNTVAMPFPFNSSVINWNEDVSIIPDMTKIISIRNNSMAIRRGKLSSYVKSDICAFKKDYETERVFVVINLRNADKTFVLPDAVANTSMHDELNNTDVSLDTAITLSAYEYKVFSTEIPVSVNDNFGNENAFSVYPNPVCNGQLKLTISKDCDNANIIMYDFSGKTVFASTLSPNQKTIDVSEFNKGIYLVEIKSGMNHNIQKVIIK